MLAFSVAIRTEGLCMGELEGVVSSQSSGIRSAFCRVIKPNTALGSANVLIGKRTGTLAR